MYQFVHVESYSRSTPKRASSINKKTGKVSSAKSSGHCVSYIVNEAIREVNSIPHVKNPLPPEYLHGEPLETLEQACNDWANSVKDGRGHVTRKDALCLAAGIVSAPKDITPEAWDAFQRDSVQWLKDKYGPALRTVIAHHDESHPHLHFYAVPEPGQRFESIHQGRLAAAQVKAEGGLKGLQNQAYKQAMREFQDEFYEKVGIEHGFTRIGPAKRRLTREEWKLEQIQSAAAALAIAKAKEATELSEAQSAMLIADAKAEALVVATTALKNADAIVIEAEKTGLQKGLDAAMDLFEKMPWYQRAKAVFSRFTARIEQRAQNAEAQVDGLTEQLDKTTTKLEKVVGEKKVVDSKLKRAIDIGLPWERRAKKAEADLAKAQEKAAAGDVALQQRDDLVEALDRAEDRARHWEAVADAHMPKPVPVAGIPGKKTKLTQGIEVEPGA